MSLGVLFRHNVRDPYRSGSLWILLGSFTILFGIMGYLLRGSVGGGLSFAIAQILAVLGPLAALGFTYDSIAGPRESGALRVQLSYPYTRRELVLGTLAGRIAVVGAGVTVGIVAGVLSTLVFGGVVDFGMLVPIAVLALLLSTAIVGLAMGISTSVRTSSRAAITAFGAYLLFSAFWNYVPTLLRLSLNGFSRLPETTPEWVFVWRQLNPINAFRTATAAIAREPLSSNFYHAIWFGVLVLVGWFVLATVLGTLRFERTDL